MNAAMPNEYLLIALIVFAAGFVQGLSGFGSALIAIPLLSLFLPLRFVVPFILLIGTSINLMLLRESREHVHVSGSLLLIAGSLPGIPLGVITLAACPEWTLQLILGGLLMFISLSALTGRSPRLPPGPGWAVASGLISGWLGGSLGTSGPPAIIYCSSQPWPKERIKATLVSYFLVSGLLVIGAQATQGFFTSSVLYAYLLALPVLFLGTACGATGFKRINQAQYVLLINCMLAILGVISVIKGVL
ncbi:sulfite exporter TauE/SafE family protein [Desulfovermiculus halophilus]|uniref:sulfite exporter TauE/SafE family protein n=1 Tax=Desulfovermiculus halophilus TaxID=339722 RepID=UPI00048629BB|nr:sulfite exporter TauE/SafE family protein [Desulfovermiculus halophilus]